MGDTHFLQSKEWEGFQRSIGRETFRADGVLVTKLPLIFGRSYLYTAGVSDLGFRIYDLREIARRENAVFLKHEPMNSSGTVPDEFKKSKKEIQPQKTIVLDLSKSEEELLAGMHGKTRYNVRLASQTPTPKCQMLNDSSRFWELMQKTSKRDGFSTHTKEYYEKLLGLSIAQLFIAEHGGKVIAANIILFYGDTAYYLHGASDYEHRSLMAPYLLHWKTIKYAKEKGYKRYDFWGIDEKKWPGVTRFKRGFGGREVEYIGSYDYVFSPIWYWAYKLRQFIR